MADPTPTLDGTTIVLGDARLTPGEARGLAGDLRNLASQADLAARRAREAEARAQREAEIRTEGGVDCTVRGTPTVARLAVYLSWGTLRVRSWGTLRVRTPDGWRDLRDVDAWPTPVRVRVSGGRVAHRWQGGGYAPCGLYVSGAREIAGADVRDCPRCVAKVGTLLRDTS